MILAFWIRTVSRISLSLPKIENSYNKEKFDGLYMKCRKNTQLPYLKDQGKNLIIFQFSCGHLNSQLSCIRIKSSLIRIQSRSWSKNLDQT
jgi:hypothetical protein